MRIILGIFQIILGVFSLFLAIIGFGRMSPFWQGAHVIAGIGMIWSGIVLFRSRASHTYDTLTPSSSDYIAPSE